MKGLHGLIAGWLVGSLAGCVLCPGNWTCVPTGLSERPLNFWRLDGKLRQCEADAQRAAMLYAPTPLHYGSGPGYISTQPLPPQPSPPPAAPPNLAPVPEEPTPKTSSIHDDKAAEWDESPSRTADHVQPAVGLEDASQPATSSSRKADSPNQPVTPTLPLVPSPDGRTSENYSTLTLNQAVYASLNGHPTIAAGLEAIRQAEGDFITSTLAPNPTFFTDIQMLPFKGAFKPTRQGGPPQQDAFVTYPIDWFLFGKRAAAMASQNYAVHVTQAGFQDLIRVRIAQSATAFFDLVEAQALQDLARTNVEGLEEVARRTELAVQDGGRPAVELSRIRLDVLSAMQELRGMRTNLATAEANLRALTGLTDWQIPVKAEWDLATPLPSVLVPIDEALIVAERERPDLEAMRWQINKTGADIVVAHRAARPTVAPSLGWTHQYQKEIDQPDADSWDANVTMSVPMFDRNQGNICKAQAAERQAQHLYHARVLEVRAEVQQAVAALRTADENARAVADEQLELAQKVRDSIVTAYQEGGRPLIDVLDAQRNFRETNRLYLTTRAGFWRALYRYYAAIGRQDAPGS